jgi:hypothetical protein
VDYDGNHLDQPEIVAFVQIGDGGLIHRLGEISPDDINIGMSLEAVIKPKDQREGSILDIEYFRPTE